VGDAAALPFADETFDVVVTRYSFHHIPEPGRVLAEMRRVCRPGGRVVVIDATPTAETQAAYDRMETLRDPSHASALTQAQLRALAARTGGLTEATADFHRLEALLSTLSDPERAAELTALFEADIDSGADAMGVRPWRAADGVRFLFPITILAWTRS
jgi:ubiquinone/menaquinone biosynthesis C-methylase UbiE